MMKNAKWLVLSLVFYVGLASAQNESVTINLEGEQLIFKFVALEGASPVWYQIYVEIDGEAMLASRHELTQLQQPTCNSLRYLRAWLTAADNGVNGKRSPNHMPLNGAESEALTVKAVAERYYQSIQCNEQNNEGCLQCLKETSTVGESFWVDVCEDLKDLSQLALGINQEAASQSHTGKRGKGFY